MKDDATVDKYLLPVELKVKGLLDFVKIKWGLIMRKEALLYLHEICNYSCSYCMLGDSNYKRSESKANTREGTIKIIDFFNKRKEWSILITGGEPTEHPYFIELVEELTKENYIILDTNNSMDGDKLEEFISRINSNRIEYIQCSLHEIDETPDRLEQYVDRIKKLKENGHKVFVTYVATPKRIPSIPHLYNRFYENNIPFVIVPLRTPEYPKSYNEKEREILDQYMSSSIHRGYLEIDDRKVLGATHMTGGTNKFYFAIGYEPTITKTVWKK